MRITKRQDTPEGREFWKPAEQAHEKVKRWPRWKRAVKVTQFTKLRRRTHE